jgi:hypothetical protein
VAVYVAVYVAVCVYGGRGHQRSFYGFFFQLEGCSRNLFGVFAGLKLLQQYSRKFKTFLRLVCFCSYIIRANKQTTHACVVIWSKQFDDISVAHIKCTCEAEGKITLRGFLSAKLGLN